MPSGPSPSTEYERTLGPSQILFCKYCPQPTFFVILLYIHLFCVLCYLTVSSSINTLQNPVVHLSSRACLEWLKWAFAYLYIWPYWLWPPYSFSNLICSLPLARSLPYVWTLLDPKCSLPGTQKSPFKSYHYVTLRRQRSTSLAYQQKYYWRFSYTSILVVSSTWKRYASHYLHSGLSNNLKICRAFYNTTRSRQLWYNFIKSLESLKVRPPEEPLEKYSAGELERWVSRRCWALVPWNSFYCNVFRYPLHDIGDRPLSNRSIVPGGRWLLVLKHGEVYAIDLNSSRLEGRPLFHLGADYGGGWLCGRFKCDYWIDDTKPQLSFRVGVWGGSGDNTNRGFTFILEKSTALSVTQEAHLSASRSTRLNSQGTDPALP